jgi:hypothetical protein
MKLLSLDLARKTGVSYGDASCAKPQSFSVELYREGGGYHDGAGKLGVYLNEWLQVNGVDAIAVEDIMDPAAQHSHHAIISGILYAGVVHGLASNYDVPVYRVKVASARKHFCGRATAHPPRRPGTPQKSEWQIKRDREDTKNMVWRRCVQLGYVGAGDRIDYDRSDSLCIWDYAAHTVCRATRPLVLNAGAGW